jgi:tetratricopeptide (TPR) repeat protein
MEDADRQLGSRRDDSAQHPIRLVYCLCMDLIGSTQAGLQLTTQRLDRFNAALIEQIQPHVDYLGLGDALIKFTGDGWLVMTEAPDSVPGLCCLAVIMANRFQEEMSQKTGIAVDHIPALRLTVCCGRDIRVELAGGGWDWAGDSARRATRASGYCYPNEILIDETVRLHVFRDFQLADAALEDRPPEYRPKRVEEPIPLHTLRGLKPSAGVESDAPECYVYTLRAVGRVQEAAALVSLAANHLAEEGTKRLTDQVDQQEELHRWNRLLHSAPLYHSALDVLRTAATEGIQPNVVTYSSLISISPDYDTASRWLETMKDEGIQPDVVTYSSLISISPDYDTASRWLETMKDEGIQPNVVTYSSLISISPDYDTASRWLETMKDEGIQPDVVTYNSVLSRDLSDAPAAKLLDWYLSQQYHPEEPIQAAIASYRKAGLIQEALLLALHYPHLQAARKVIRTNPDDALSFFESVCDSDPDDANGPYALGIALMELGREEEAQPHLARALVLARAGRRKAAIERCLSEIAAQHARESPSSTGDGLCSSQ